MIAVTPYEYLTTLLSAFVKVEEATATYPLGIVPLRFISSMYAYSCHTYCLYLFTSSSSYFILPSFSSIVCLKRLSSSSLDLGCFALCRRLDSSFWSWAIFALSCVYSSSLSNSYSISSFCFLFSSCKSCIYATAWLSPHALLCVVLPKLPLARGDTCAFAFFRSVPA